MILKDYPLGKFGEAIDFAQFAKCVIENNFLNGTVQRIDGGSVTPYRF